MFKSRYTASLEEQVADLKQQVKAKDERIDQLYAQILAAGRLPVPVNPSSHVPPKETLPLTHKQRPPVNNFLQTRSLLESASMVPGLEITPADPKENEA